jgi:cytosine deaminase
MGRLHRIAASTIGPIDMFMSDEGRVLADMMAETGGNLGCGTRFLALNNSPVPPEFDVVMDHIFTLAEERGLDLDMHVDESSDPEARTLIRIARLALKRGFKGRILAGHCCALALQTDEVIADTMDACKDAGIDIVSLPAVNPTWRRPFGAMSHARHAGAASLARITEGARPQCGDRRRQCARSVHGYGDHDMPETYPGGKDRPSRSPHGDWIRAVTAVPAGIMQLDNWPLPAAGPG